MGALQHWGTPPTLVKLKSFARCSMPAPQSMTSRPPHAPLGAAALGGQVGAARILVEAGATLDLADETGMTPLIHAARVGQLAVVRFLVEAGADLQHRDIPDHVHAKSALDYAVDEGFPEVARYLLESGARFEPEVYLDESGATPNHASNLIDIAHRNRAAKRLQDG